MTRSVIIVSYDPQWPDTYKEEKALILRVIGDTVLQIEHIGSTAVPGLGAKPIIDIMVGVRRISDVKGCIEPLATVGYEYVSLRYFRKGPPERHRHLHVTELGSEFWESHILFRDYLCAHPETAQEYYELKKKLAAKFKSDGDAFTDAKSEFIERVIEKVRKELK
jgi:GrpB-like predicted nucleotidyltransferase (UPF0157 family)